MIHRHLYTLGAGAIVLAAAADFSGGRLHGKRLLTTARSRERGRARTRITKSTSTRRTAAEHSVASASPTSTRPIPHLRHVGAVSNFTLTLTESDAAFSTPGSLQFWLAPDTTTSIDAGSPP